MDIHQSVGPGALQGNALGHDRFCLDQRATITSHQSRGGLLGKRKPRQAEADRRAGCAKAEELAGGGVPDQDVVVAVYQHHRPGKVFQGIGVARIQGVKLFAAQLHFLVGGLQLFVQRLQFFIGSFQLFVGRLQLFVGGLKFFVGGLQLLVGGFQFFIGGLQLFRSGLQRFDGALQLLFGADVFHEKQGAGAALIFFGHDRPEGDGDLAVIGRVAFKVDLNVAGTRGFEPRWQLGTARRQFALGQKLAHQFFAGDAPEIKGRGIFNQDDIARVENDYSGIERLQQGVVIQLEQRDFFVGPGP